MIGPFSSVIPAAIRPLFALVYTVCNHNGTRSATRLVPTATTRRFDDAGSGTPPRPDIPLATETDASTLLKYLRPDAVYTTMRTCASRSRIFGYDAHLDRLGMAIEEGEERRLLHRNVRAQVRVLVGYFGTQVENADPTCELKLTAAVTPLPFGDDGADDSGGTYEIVLHVASLPFARSGIRRAVPTNVRLVPSATASRTDLGAVKSAAWIAGRSAVSLDTEGGYEEGLLLAEVEKDDAILEGMSSNVFVIYGGEGPLGLTIRTAPVDSNILPGTVRSMVIDAAKENRINIDFRPPRLSERNHWVSVFITSTSRLVLPIDAVWGQDGERGKTMEKVWSTVTKGAGENHSQAIQLMERIGRRVEEMIVENSSLVFLDTA